MSRLLSTVGFYGMMSTEIRRIQFLFSCDIHQCILVKLIRFSTVVLDMDEGTLAFVVEGQYLGVAFRGLKGKKLYPIVSAVWGHCEITIRYIGGLDRKSSLSLSLFIIHMYIRRMSISIITET